MHYEVLPNGTEILLAEEQRHSHAALQVWVKVGSLCEQEGETGMAHFIEHMLFKGTATSKVGELWQRVESWGGDINAYTGFDCTVYHMTLGVAHILNGIAALHDAIYHSVLDVDEIAKEKEVVCEEIKQYQDDPSDCVHEKARQLAFQKRVHPILGTSCTAVRAFSKESLHQFYRAHYVPANMAVVAVGAFTTTTVREKIAQLFGNMPARTPPSVTAKHIAFTPDIQTAVLHGDYHKPRLLLKLPAPSQNNIDACAFDLAAFVLGSGDAARFNVQLRDQQQLATAISCSNSNSLYWGMLEINALTSVANMPALITATVKVLQDLRQRVPLTAAELRRAQVNAKVDFALQNETAAGLADNLGYGLTTPWKHLFSSCYFTALEQMSPMLVQQALARWLNFKQAAIVCAIPANAQLDAAELHASFQHASSATPPIAVSTRRRTPQSKVVVSALQLRPGVRLIHQADTQNEMCNLVAVTRGGLALENSRTNGTHNAIAALLGQANAAYDHRRLVMEIEGRGASLSGFFDKDCIGLQLQCLKKDVTHFAKIFAACLTQPQFPDERWQMLAAEINDSIALRNEDPFSFCMQKYRQVMFAGHPYSLPLTGTDTTSFTADNLLENWHRARSQGMWVIAANIDMKVTKLKTLLLETLPDFDPPAQLLTIPTLPELTTSCSRSYAKAREQCHVVYGLRGLNWQAQQRATLDVLLKLTAQRLFDTMREKQGWVYSVTPILTYGIGGGTFGIHTACAPDKEAQATAAIAAELQHGKPPTAAEIKRAQQYLVGNWDMEMAKGEGVTMHMARMELFGVGYDNVDAYPRRLLAVNADDIANLATQLLHNRPHVCVRVGAELR